MEPEVFELNAHSELCANQAYCLNGGTCYLLVALGRHYCECAESFEGERCHLKVVGVPDYDTLKTYEGILLSWNGLLPVAIVVGVAILFMVALFCIYVCSKKCYQKRYQKYHITSPVKILRYQNASAQTSISQLHLLCGDNQCNGRLVSAMNSSSRTRLPACSATPENAENSLQNLSQTGRSCIDLESGSCTEADLSEPGYASTQPWITRTEYDATDACRDYRRNGTDHAANSTPSRSQRTTNYSQGASAPCLSPNDSNNNKDAFTGTSSQRVVDPVKANCYERTRLLFQPANCILNNCVRDFDSTNHKAVNCMSSDLHDSDPEATAL